MLQVYPASYLAACINPQGVGSYPMGTPGIPAAPAAGPMAAGTVPVHAPPHNGVHYAQPPVTSPAVVQTPAFGQPAVPVQVRHALPSGPCSSAHGNRHRVCSPWAHSLLSACLHMGSANLHIAASAEPKMGTRILPSVLPCLGMAADTEQLLDTTST